MKSVTFTAGNMGHSGFATGLQHVFIDLLWFDWLSSSKQCVFGVYRHRTPRLKASEFIAGNTEHMQALSRMGIHLVTMSDGRVQLLHISSQVNWLLGDFTF